MNPYIQISEYTIPLIKYKSKDVQNGIKKPTELPNIDHERKKAQVLLRKSKIIYKLINNKPLNSQDTEFIKHWKTLLKFNQKYEPSLTSITFNDLTDNDMALLNESSYVNFKGLKYSVSDLVLELAVYIDASIIDKVEGAFLSMLEQSKVYHECVNKNQSLIYVNTMESLWNKAVTVTKEDIWNITGMMDQASGSNIIDNIYVNE